MKHIKYIGIMMIAVGLLTATSCSDFDDYNKVTSDVNASASQTLWANISGNPQLSNFAALIKKAGFDDELQSSTFYTVWAPLDGTYDAASLMASDNATVLKQFVKNHIASYNYPASGTIDERIHSLNLKSHTFTGSGSYTYAGMALPQVNLPSTNGVMHVLNGYAKFYPNLYEYISQGAGIDSLKAYFKKYEYTFLDVSKSVIGPVVKGKQTYIDSVMVTYNLMANSLNANLEEEDSMYTFMLPNNAAWIAAYNKIKPYYKYASTTYSQVLTDGSTDVNTSKNVSVNAAYMQDSLVKSSIVSSLIFSNNNSYNKWVENTNAVSTDTISTTTRNKLSNPDAILAHTVNKFTMSNGYARVIDSVAYLPWETYAPEHIYTSAYLARVLNGSKHNVRVDDPDDAMGDFSKRGLNYLWIQPTSNFSKPELDIYLPNVLSTTYNIYCVVIPADVDLTDKSTVVKPNQLKFDLSYATASGTLATKTLAAALSNDTSKVDTMLVGQFTFPVAYRGLGDYYPNIKITTPFSVFSTTMMAKYTRDLRIGGIILRPIELDAYKPKE